MLNMKKTLAIAMLMLAAVFTANSQEMKEKKVLSPKATATGEYVEVHYSQPSMRHRKIFGELVPYGEVWRTGANEATTFEVNRDVKVEGQALKAGKYGLFTVPGENEWTIIFNKTVKWGAYSYKKEDDVLRVTVKPTKTAAPVEAFNISVGKNDVVIKWENTSAAFKVQ